MKMDPQGRCVALIRVGDYFVIRSGREGTSFDFAPDGEDGARVIGAFITANTGVRYYDAGEASEFIRQFGDGAEDHLLSSAKIMDLRGEEPLQSMTKELSTREKVVRGLVAMAASMECGRTWDGTLEEFYQDIFCLAVSGVPFDKETKVTIRKIANLGLGIHQYGQAKDGRGVQRVSVDWDQLSSHTESLKI